MNNIPKKQPSTSALRGSHYIFEQAGYNQGSQFNFLGYNTAGRGSEITNVILNGKLVVKKVPN
jgi:hypothetical protein